MAVAPGDIRFYGSAVMADDNTATNIGGAVTTSRRCDFSDVTGLLQAVSSVAADTTQTVTVTYKDTTGAVQTLTLGPLTGTTPATSATGVDRVLKAIKSATAVGRVAVEAQTAELTGTLPTQSGVATNQVVLPSAASAADDTYNGYVLRLTGGTGSGQIVQIIDYVGSTRLATLNEVWPVAQPDGTSTFRLSKGLFFDKAPNEVTEVRRIAYNTTALNNTGVAYYDLLYVYNTNNTSGLSSDSVLQYLNSTGKISFGLGAAIQTAYSNGVGNNRTVAPAGVVFAQSPAALPTAGNPGGGLLAGSYIALWVKLGLVTLDAAQRSSVTLKNQGTM